MVLGFNVENGCEFCSVGADGFIDPISQLFLPIRISRSCLSPGIAILPRLFRNSAPGAMMLLGFAGLGYAGVKRASKITLA